jgi:hypothetical protein
MVILLIPAFLNISANFSIYSSAPSNLGHTIITTRPWSATQKPFKALRFGTKSLLLSVMRFSPF